VPEMSRRMFLGTIGLGAVAWACGGSDEQVTSSPSPDAADDLSLFATAPQGLAVGDSRQGFAIIEGSKPISPAAVSIRLIPPDGEPPGPIEATKATVRFGLGGDEDHEHETEVQDIFVIRHTFEFPGVWEAEASFEGRTVRTAFQVARESTSPAVGEEAKAVASPTTADPMDADPVCTRTPPCSMHDVTIADALAGSTPVVITFATPRYCTSRTCGPVVDIVEVASEEIGDAAEFVHVEVWRDGESVGDFEDGFVQAFADYGFQTEPWTYFIGADGVVRDRWQGAVGAEELLGAVKALVAGDL